MWAVPLSTTKLIPRCLTPKIQTPYSEFGWTRYPCKGPHPSSALPRRHGLEASPKAISERTSYHPPWLAFHSYSQLIPHVFNHGGSGPPSAVKRTSSCP